MSDKEWVRVTGPAAEVMTGISMREARDPAEVVESALREYYAMRYVYTPQHVISMREEVINNNEWVEVPTPRFNPCALAPGNKKSSVVVPFDNGDPRSCSTLLWNRIHVSIDRAKNQGKVGMGAIFTVKPVDGGYEVRRLK